MKAEKAATFRVLAARDVGGKKWVSVQQILEWAFRREKVSLELPRAEEAMIGAGYGVGSSQRLVQFKEIGCFVDGGGSSACHEDAETVAALLGGLPDDLGGRRFAIQIAEWARMGVTPDWMPGAYPRIIPAAFHTNRHGEHAASVALEPDVSGWEGRSRACPITYLPTRQQIDMARRTYVQWRSALRDLRANLSSSRMLRAHELTGILPPMAPWEKSS